MTEPGWRRMEPGTAPLYAVVHLSGVGMYPSNLVLVPNDGRWPDFRMFFEHEAGRIRKALETLNPMIEHIGSTAVPGCQAVKPIVDIGVLIASSSDFPACVNPLEALGYQHRGPNGPDPLRRYYTLSHGGRRFVHLHVWAVPAKAWHDALQFRDLLRSDVALRDAYADEKRRVAEEVEWDKKAYSLAKGPFIEAVLHRGASGRAEETDGRVR